MSMFILPYNFICKVVLKYIIFFQENHQEVAAEDIKEHGTKSGSKP